jgi:hypothetical protein
MEPEYSRKTYSANNQINVTYKVNNPNADIADMYLDINFNPEFTLVPGSLQITQVNPAPVKPVQVTPEQDDPFTLGIAGSVSGEKGFDLPVGETVIKFKLQAPDAGHIQLELDDSGQPTGENAPLNIVYSFSSTMSDPCALMAIEGLDGDGMIPYWAGKTHIISNRHITSEINR